MNTARNPGRRKPGLTPREAQRAFKLLKEAREALHACIMDMDYDKALGIGAKCAVACFRIGGFLRKHGAEEERKAWADKEGRDG